MASRDTKPFKLSLLTAQIFSIEIILHLIFTELTLKNTHDDDHVSALCLVNKRLHASGMPYYARAVHWNEGRSWADLPGEEERMLVPKAFYSRRPDLTTQVKLVSLSTSDTDLAKHVVSTFRQAEQLHIGTWSHLDVSGVAPLRQLRYVHLQWWQDDGPIGPNTDWCEVLFQHSQVNRLHLGLMCHSDIMTCLSASHATLRWLDLNYCNITDLTTSQWSDLFALTPGLRTLKVDNATSSMLRSTLPVQLRILELGSLCMCEVLTLLSLLGYQQGILNYTFHLLRKPLEACIRQHSLMAPSPPSVKHLVEAQVAVENPLLASNHKSLRPWNPNTEPTFSETFEGAEGLIVFVRRYEYEYNQLAARDGKLVGTI